MAATQSNSLTRISSGLQDTRLQPAKGNPTVAQFVKVLRRTTRWASQWRRVDFDGEANFGKKVSLTVPRLGDLLNGVTLVVTMPDIYTSQQAARNSAPAGTFLGPTYGWTNALGHALIQTVELEIGGAIVETLDGRLLEVLDELYEPVETIKAKNRMIARAATGFTESTWGNTVTPTTVYVPLPFWFSRPDRMSHALPVDAINAERVRIHVTFRPIEQLYYTDARMDPRTVGFREGIDVSGAMPALQGGRFWRQNPTASTRVYFMNRTMPYGGVSGELIGGVTMPTRLDMSEAYMILDYISLEEPEAVAMRSAELTYFVEQHNALQPQATQRTQEVRVLVPLTNPTKEILWVAQRPEVATYNAWFLFTRDLGPYSYVRLNAQQQPVNPPNPTAIPWWPDAVLQPEAANDWKILPAFRNADSEPITGASLYYNSYERFVLTGGSLFRSLIPTQKATKAAVHDRYVYMWSFGMEEPRRDMFEPRGAANWDKLPRKEMFFTMSSSRECDSLNGYAPPDMTLYIWTTNWNVLKVYGGRAGLLYTN